VLRLGLFGHLIIGTWTVWSTRVLKRLGLFGHLIKGSWTVWSTHMCKEAWTVWSPRNGLGLFGHPTYIK
jgi:hypothetical protein